MKATVGAIFGGIVMVAAVYIVLEGKRAQNADTIAKGVTGQFGHVDRVFQGGN